MINFKNHKKILILIDLEPDDMLALWIFLSWLISASNGAFRDTPIMFVVGEGKYRKVKMMNGLVTYFKIVKYGKIIQGKHSNKDFPIAMADYFHGIPKESGNENTITEIDDFLKDVEHPLILALKPIWELLDMDEDIAKKCTLALYGSFNFRTMFKWLDPKKISKFINNGFLRVILYESYLATGDQNSVNPSNARVLFDRITSTTDGYFKVLSDMIRLWNEFMAEDCKKDVIKYTAKLKDMDSSHEDYKRFQGKVHRNQKVLDSITEGEFMQMVLADFGLITCLVKEHPFKVKKGIINFNEWGYTEMTEDSEGKIELICDVPFKEMVNLIQERL